MNNNNKDAGLIMASVRVLARHLANIVKHISHNGVVPQDEVMAGENTPSPNLPRAHEANGPSQIEIHWDDRTVPWIDELATVFGRYKYASTPEQGSSQETAVFDLPKSTHENTPFKLDTFEGVTVKISRGFIWERPYFRLHINQIEQGNPGQQQSFYDTDVLAMVIDKDQEYVAFYTAEEDGETPHLLAKIYSSGKMEGVAAFVPEAF